MRYKFVHNRLGDTTAQESTIDSNSSKVINYDQPLGSVDYNDKINDSMLLYTLTIQQGNKITHTNFKNKKYWELKKATDYKASYKLFVDTTLLNRK